MRRSVEWTLALFGSAQKKTENSKVKRHISSHNRRGVLLDQILLGNVNQSICLLALTRAHLAVV